MQTRRNIVHTEIVHTERHIAAIQEHAMPTLTALGEPAKIFAGGVLFMMMDGPTRITCWVSREALDRFQRDHHCQQDPMTCFERHRPKIERLAGHKYDAGERSPIVMSFDLETVR
jgi:hypothetical protein